MATRTERVRLELEDAFSTQMAKAAAATALLDKNLNHLSGSSVQTSRDSDKMQHSIKGTGDEVNRTSSKLRDGANDLDRYSGRLRLITEAAVALGPGLVTVGAAGVPAIAGLAAGFGAAAGAAGIALLAFNGVGDALESIDAYKLEPTTANLEKMQAELDKLGPAGEHFARYLSSIEPQLRSLQMAAREGLLPGVERGIDNLLTLLPQVRTIIFDVATGMGRLADEAGEALAGDRFAGFFNYLETDARPTLEAMGHSIGNLTAGLASLVVAFAPLTRDFSSGMESMTRSFADWAEGLSQTDGFREFVDYVRQSGPQVVDLLAALGNAFVGIIKAAAPVGQVVVPALTALANILGAVANSPVGPALFATAAALLAINRAATLTSRAVDAFGASTLATTGSLTGMQRAAVLAGTALAGLAVVDALQSTDKAVPGINALTNELNALAATAGGDLPAGFDNLGAGIDRLADPNRWQSLQDSISGALGGIGNDSLHDNAVKQIEALDAALTNMVNTQGPEVAGKALERLAQAAGLSGEQFKDLLSLLPGYSDAVAGAAGATDKAAHSTKGLGENAGRTATEVRGLISAMEDQTNAALGAFDAVTQYARALEAARKRAKESSAGIGTNTEEQRKNRDALSQLASAWNNQGAAVRDNIGKYAAAREALVKTAVQMGATRQRANELAGELLDIPKFIAVRVDAYTDKAKSQVQNILNELARIPRSISTPYYVNQLPAGVPFAKEAA